MKKKITDLLRLSLKGNDDSLLELVERFSPLIKSYGKKVNQGSWSIDGEDMESMLKIKLIELTKTIKIADSEGENVKFIATCLKNHFLNIVGKTNKIKDREEVFIEEVHEREELDKKETFFNDMLKCLDDNKGEIVRIKFQNMYTDKEIADELGITRQAVNKQLRKAYTQILERYINPPLE